MSLEHYADKYLNPPSFQINDRVKPWQDIQIVSGYLRRGKECIVVEVNKGFVGVLYYLGDFEGVSYHVAHTYIHNWLLEKIE